jgi:hypothetical protein
MIKVFVLVMWTAGQTPALTTQEFISQATCEAAKAQVAAAQEQSEDYRRFRMICTEK